jgi:class 3 adenylate cyclase
MMSACLKFNPADRPTTTGLSIRLSWINSQLKKEKENEDIGPDLSPLLEQNIPRHMIDALQEGRLVKPETHDCVTIICAHISGFDSIMSSMSPNKVTNLLDRVHLLFDELCEELDIFSVDTIADGSCMFVCNIEGSQPHHASIAARFGVDSILRAARIPIDEGNPTAGYVQLRFGFHSGSVVSHLIGSKNARFTLIGDTVNTAIAMETSSMPCKALCSGDSYHLLQKEWGSNEFHVEEYDVIQMKGRDDVQAYWVEDVAEEVVTC